MTDTGGMTAALVAFQSELPKIGKGSTADTGAYTYTYTDLADLAHTVLPLLAKQGIAYSCTLTRVTDGEFLLVAQLRHISGEVIAAEWPVPVKAPQSMGSALTYGRRYLLLAMTGVAPAGEDDDAALASKEHAKLARDTVKTPRKATRAATTRDDTDEWNTAPKVYRGPKITDAQQRKLGVAMRERGITERIAALDYVANVIGHPIDSRTDLTLREAAQVIDALETPAIVDVDTGELT